MRYDARLATTIAEPVSRRLRMLALVRGERLSHLLTSLLDQHLPTTEELADLLQEKGAS